MLGFLLLRGKDFSLPEGVSTVVIGLFFGLVAGLFYYQHYYRPWFWAISFAGGLILTEMTTFILHRWPGIDAGSVEVTLAEFVVPFFLTLALNHALYMFKTVKRKSRLRRKTHSRFFENLSPHDILPRDSPKVDTK